MRKSTKSVASLLAVTLLAGMSVSTAGCGRDDGIVIDHTRTQLYVSVYDAGIGRTWMEKTIVAFERDMANHSFQENRKGVQVIPDYNRDNIGNGPFYEGVEGSANNVFFTENNNYQMWVQGEKLYDLTEVFEQGAITGTDEEGNFLREDGSVKSKINDTFLGYLNTGSSTDAEYYALPYYLSNKGFIYDRDLWNEKYFYFGKNGAPSEGVVKAIQENGDVEAAKESYYSKLEKDFESSYGRVNGSGYDEKGTYRGLSAGPDGKYGTLDDGLPATYEEFYDLMTMIKKANVVPIIWGGKNPGYADMITTAAWQNDAGVAELEAFYSLTGTMDELVVFENGKMKKDGNGNIVTEPKTFDGGVDDGYDVQRSITKLRALEFVDTIAKSDWVHSSGFDSTSHIQAQAKFLTSATKSERIAMLIEGAWWQQESSATFSIMEGKDKKWSKENRDLAMMTLPNSSVERYVKRMENDEKYTIVSQSESFCFVNGNLSADSPQLQAALAFVSYTCSEKALEIFTQETQMLRPVRATFNEEQKAGFTKYTRNIIEYLDTANVIYPYSSNSFVNQNKQYLNNDLSGWLWHTDVSGVGEYSMPLTTLANETLNKKGLTAQTYFEGMYDYYKNMMWSKLKK